jgi:hypothetical protein
MLANPGRIRRYVLSARPTTTTGALASPDPFTDDTACACC